MSTYMLIKYFDLRVSERKKYSKYTLTIETFIHIEFIREIQRNFWYPIIYRLPPMAEWGIIRASWLIPCVYRVSNSNSSRTIPIEDSSCANYIISAHETQIGGRRYVKITRNELTKKKKMTVHDIHQSFQAISDVPSKTLDDALIKKTTLNGRSQHIRYNASKNTYVRINQVIIDTCHCEQYMLDSMCFLMI